MKEFKVTRIFSDEAGESHFAEMLIPMGNAGEIGALSEMFPVKGIIFREVEPAYDYDFHRAPQRQFIILLEGEIQIETSLGDVRTFSAGEVLLAEDVEGRGHRSKNIYPDKRRSVFVLL